MKAQGWATVIAVVKAPSAAAGAAAAATTFSLSAAPPRKSQRSAMSAVRDCFLSPGSRERESFSLAAASTPKKRGGKGSVRLYENLGVMLGAVDRDGLKALQANQAVAKVVAAPQISLIRPTRRTRLSAIGDAALDSAGQFTWGLSRLGVPQLRGQGLTGKGVLVGHLDTGVDGKHPAFKSAIAHFAEFDADGEQVPNAAPTDSDDHGTHTAGTILGRPQSGVEFGVASEADLASAMVIEGGDVIARILGGMDWAVGLNVRILNMSLGLRGFVDDFLPLTLILRQRGILPVFAVGNEGRFTSRSPGNYPEALSVGASNVGDEVAGFSSSQRFTRSRDPLVPDLVAPGVDVASAVPGGGFAALNGSSMATPHIAGLAALLMQAKPGATVQQVEQAIFDSCRRPATMRSSRANRGVPDGPRALSLLG